MGQHSDGRSHASGQKECRDALTRWEELKLLAECAKSRSRALRVVVVVALCTGLRFSELRFLRWANIDLQGTFLTVGQSKTEHGEGREIPLNKRALNALQGWAEKFPDRRPYHFVFGSEKASGPRKGTQQCNYYEVNPTKPVNWSICFRNAVKRAGIWAQIS